MRQGRDAATPRRAARRATRPPPRPPESGVAIRPYLEQHHIPIVGGDVYDQLWHESPMLFPQALYINNLHYATAAATVQSGKKSFALMWCAEVAACGAAVPYWESSIAKL